MQFFLFASPLCDIDAAWYERGEQSSPVISPLWKLINFSGALRYKINNYTCFLKYSRALMSMFKFLNMIITYSMRGDNVYLPYRPTSILGVPESGRV